jgi:hypothetical protein
MFASRIIAGVNNKHCVCNGCESGTHKSRRDAEPSECLARYSDAAMLWEDGICPGCLSHRRRSGLTDSCTLPI